MNEKILKIPYEAVRKDWNLLQQFLKMKGNPRYIIIGDVDLRDRQDISDLGNLVGVKGDLILANSSIESLDELEFVEGIFSLYDCQNIKTLGKLKRVEDSLRLSYSSIQSLGELTFIEGNLILRNCENITTLGKLKRVEGFVGLDGSPIESLGELEFVGENLCVRETNVPQSEIDKVNVVGSIFK
jgi:glutamine cyclotransferase